jgi:uncharacterized protein (UPF0303 family)
VLQIPERGYPVSEVSHRLGYQPARHRRQTALAPAQEQSDGKAPLEIDRFDYEFAWNLGLQIREKAINGGHDVAIEIRHGNDVIRAPGW